MGIAIPVPFSTRPPRDDATMWRVLSDNPIDGGPVLRLSWKTRENAPAFKPGRPFALRNEALGLDLSLTTWGAAAHHIRR